MRNKNYNTREQELLQDGVIINEYQEGLAYNEQESTQEYEQELQETKKDFSIGLPVTFDVENAILTYPVKKDKNGNPLTETDENGNTFYLRDDEKKPYLKFSKYGIGKKAVANIQINVFVDMLETLYKNKLEKDDKKTASKILDILDTVFPYDIIDYGTFTEQGDRNLKPEKVSYLYKSKLVLRAFPVMVDDKKSKSKKPYVLTFNWLDENKQEHSIDICYYENKPIKGAMVGIK